MVLEELKRVSGERDDMKKKFEQSEKDAAALSVEVQDWKKKAEQAAMSQEKQEDGSDSRVDEDNGSKDADASAKSPPSRIGSFSLFSPKIGVKQDAAPTASEDLFSYDSEVPRLEQELQEQTAKVDELQGQVVSLKDDLAVARESTSSMVQTLENATRELNALREEKDRFETSRTEMEARIRELESHAQTGSADTGSLRKQIEELQVLNEAAGQEAEKLKAQIEEMQQTKSELEAKLETQTKEMSIITEKLTQKDDVVKDLEDSLAAAKLAEREHAKTTETSQSREKRLTTMQGIMDNLRHQLNTAENTVAETKREIQMKQEEFANRPSSKIFGFLDERKDANLSNLKSQDEVVDYLVETYGLHRNVSDSRTLPSSTTPATTATPSQSVNDNSTGKKKNKKNKKKAGKGQTSTAEGVEPDGPIKVSEDLNDVVDDVQPQQTLTNDLVTALQQEVAKLKEEIDQKTVSIERLSDQIKDQDGLREEIETLRDDLLHQGQEHVEARDALKEAQQQRKELQQTVDRLEDELATAKKQMAASAGIETEHTVLQTRFDELKARADELQKDLGAAETLATARFKDITDLKEVLSKAQPELRQLRSEVTELKAAKDELKNREGDYKRLESRHEDLKSEMKGLGKRLGDKDSEIKELQTKIEQETKARNKVKNELSSAQLDARVAENKRKDTSEMLEQRQRDLTQAKEEASGLRRQVSGLEDKISSCGREIQKLKEEVALKTALHSSSQSLLQSLRDQSHELSMQARESSARAESLDEELTESQRMLSERTRESETMRMLLDQARNGVEARIREMKERMETAVEERDRVEDEANVRDRRLMREVEEARNKMRDAQRQLKGLEDERDDLETKNRDWRRQRTELEQQAQDAKRDVDDVKAAMKGLRDALDESERQTREIETHKADLRRQVEECNERIEKLGKANKNLSEEIKRLQDSGLTARKGSLRPAGAADNIGGVRSSRNSIESSRSPAPPLTRETSGAAARSATPTGSNTGLGTGGSNIGLSQASVDYVYLKNVLLQFMEQKDKQHQRQLVPVLGMLLNFDRKDEQKWMAAISAK